MSDRQLKFGAILHGVGGQGQQNTWLDPEIPGDASVDVSWHVARAQQAEAAGFDLVFIADSQFITADSPPHFLSRLEPLTLLSAIAASTEKIGLVATITTSYTEPFHVARQVASLDLISRGRAGWNVVTSIDQGTATNYNRQDHLDYATRYSRALEHVTVAQGLWDSYEDDAFPRDKEAGVFFDRTRQHELNHVGEHFSVAGPLNVERSPQGRPVIFQAGNSEEGRDLAATVGEGIFTHAHSFEEGQAFYAEMKERAAAKGRNPDEMVIMPALLPTIGDTDEEAHQLKEAREGAKDFTKQLADFSRAYGQHDFTQYDPDGPFPFEVAEFAARGGRTASAKAEEVAREQGLTLRETVIYAERAFRTGFVGSPQTVADEIERWFLGGAADGFMFMVNVPSEFARFTDEVLPILRERGLASSGYQGNTLRDHLGLAIPENPHTAARLTEARSAQ
ncbi:MAG TPA: NtaA/DmoA family FMN-dependent monooxygenase [Solirubrobacterales bacterium]|nr:NtaA/DmoA family FMN-dependent monooxygenase [Solirubrobacterales bacterium]